MCNMWRVCVLLVCLCQDAWGQHRCHVWINNFKGSTYLQSWTTYELNYIYIYCCSVPAKKKKKHNLFQYNWCLMIDDRGPPRGSEMETFQFSSAMIKIYDSNINWYVLRLWKDTALLCPVHLYHWVQGSLKVKKNYSCNLGDARKGRRGSLFWPWKSGAELCMSAAGSEGRMNILRMYYLC